MTFPLLDLEKQSRGWVSCAVTGAPKLHISLHVQACLERTLEQDPLYFSLYLGV